MRLVVAGAPSVAAAASAWRSGASSDRAAELATAAKSAGRSWRFAGHSELRETLQTAARAYEALAHEVEHRLQLGIWPALTVTVREAYRRERSARNALDYDDLLLRSRELLLRHDGVRREVRDRHRAILVDEHQDTDPVQDEILRILIGEHALAGEPRPEDPRWWLVDVGFRRKLKRVVTLEQLKAEAEALGGFALLNRGNRLSVLPVTAAQYQHILSLE